MASAWDETDLIGFFEVLPVHADIESGPGPQYTFDVPQNGRRLILMVSPLMGDLTVELYTGDARTPLFQAVYLGSPGYRVVRLHGEECLEIGAPASSHGDDDDAQAFARGLRIRLQPDLWIQVFAD